MQDVNHNLFQIATSVFCWLAVIYRIFCRVQYSNQYCEQYTCLLWSRQYMPGRPSAT